MSGVPTCHFLIQMEGGFVCLLAFKSRSRKRRNCMDPVLKKVIEFAWRAVQRAFSHMERGQWTWQSSLVESFVLHFYIWSVGYKIMPWEAEWVYFWRNLALSKSGPNLCVFLIYRIHEHENISNNIKASTHFKAHIEGNESFLIKY